MLCMQKTDLLIYGASSYLDACNPAKSSKKAMEIGI